MSDKNHLLSETWTEYLNKAIQDYHSFATQASSLDAKEFTAHQNACKAALAHILMLQKLVQPKDEKTKEPDLFDLLEQARKATDEEYHDDSFD